MTALTPEEQKKQALYRDARSSNKYDEIWQSVNKCVFCDLREKYVFYEENGVVMTISLYAYIDGHFMIVPRRHIYSTRELTQLEWDTIRKFMYIAKKMIKDVHGIKGMQLVQKDGAEAQSTVEHVHFHCIPFDAPDLCTWNYRKLKYTPLENVARYKADGKKIAAYGSKFMTKYRHASSLPVVCDLVAINDKRQVMLQERTPDTQLSPNVLTLPGGTVQNFDTSLIDELIREVQEETGYNINPDNLTLVDSQISNINRRMVSPQLKLAYRQPDQFLWNTYGIVNIPANTPLTPGDDCKEIVWVNLSDVAKHPRISPGAKQAIAKAAKQ